MTAYHNIGENVQVIENEDGEAEIIHKESGESARIGPDGFVTPSVSTEETRTDGAVYVQYRDSSTGETRCVGSFGDDAGAINDAIAHIEANAEVGTAVGTRGEVHYAGEIDVNEPIKIESSGIGIRSSWSAGYLEIDNLASDEDVFEVGLENDVGTLVFEGIRTHRSGGGHPGRHCFHFGAVSTIYINNCHIMYVGQDGMHAKGSTGITEDIHVTQTNLEFCGRDGVHFESGPDDNRVSLNFFYGGYLGWGCERHGVYLEGRNTTRNWFTDIYNASNDGYGVLIKGAQNNRYKGWISANGAGGLKFDNSDADDDRLPEQNYIHDTFIARGDGVYGLDYDLVDGAGNGRNQIRGGEINSGDVNFGTTPDHLLDSLLIKNVDGYVNEMVRFTGDLSDGDKIEPPQWNGIEEPRRGLVTSVREDSIVTWKAGGTDQNGFGVNVKDYNGDPVTDDSGGCFFHIFARSAMNQDFIS